MRARLLAASCLLAALGIAPAERACAQDADAPTEAALRPARARVVWRGALPEGCPTAAALEASVAETLGRPLVADAWDVSAELEVTTLGDGLGARIALVRADGTMLGTRTIETNDPTCTTVSDGLGLVVAMLVDLHQAEAVLHVARPVPPAPAATETWEVALVAHGAVDVGWLPDPAFVASLESLFGPGELVRVLARAGLVVPQRTGSSTLGADVWGVIGAAGACLLPHVEDWELGGCLAAEAGWLSVSGEGLASTETSDAAHVGALGTLRALFTLDSFVVGLEVGASVPVLRQRFVYTAGSEQLYFESAPITFRGALIVGIR